MYLTFFFRLNLHDSEDNLDGYQNGSEQEELAEEINNNNDQRGFNDARLNDKKDISGDTQQGAEGDRAAGKDSNKTGTKDDTKKDSVKANATKGKKVVKKPAKKPVESIENKFKIPQLPKAPTPPPMKYPKRGDKELEADSASAKDRKRREIEELKAELRKAKNARVDMEKEREAKVRRAKMLQNQMMQKRNQCR